MIEATDADLVGWDRIADFLGVTRSTLRRWILQGSDVPIFKLGAQIQANKEELRAWAKRARVRLGSE